MPTKRTRKGRPRIEPLTPSELQWLTGIEQPGANCFWSNDHRRETLERRAALLEQYARLVPEGRMPQLELDVERWAGALGRRLH